VAPGLCCFEATSACPGSWARSWGRVVLGLIPHAGTSQFDFYTDPIILEFAMGVCLGAAVTAQRRVPAPIAAAAVIAAAASYRYGVDRPLL